MEWDSKTSAWNAMSKLELQDSEMYESGISTTTSSTNNNNMFSVDLKLGSLEHMGDVPMESLKNSRGFTMPSSSSPTLSKRGRPRSAGAQTTVYCAVDGCISDLSQGREYHRRHRVCERHSKTPVVLIGGREQRFCQQCSRFHSLGEFDDAKRSCRKRLDGHNRRRRKSQPENIYNSNSGGFQTSHTGSELLQFCCPDNWPMISEPEKALYAGSQHQRVTYPVSPLWSPSCIKGEKRLPFVSGINQQTMYQASPNGISSTGTRTSSLEVSPDRVTESANSGCALSLLSRYPTQSSDICMGSTIQPMTLSSSSQVSSTALHLDYSLAQFSSSKGLEDESSASLSSTTTNNSHIFGGFQSGQDQDGFSGNRSSRIFPFSWQ